MDTMETDAIAAQLVVVKSVRAVLKEADLFCAAETLPALNARVRDLVDRAAARAKANGRRVVRPSDL